MENLKPVEVLDKFKDKLARFGGFKVVEANIKDADWVNPDSQAKKDIFLTESDYADERKSLKNELNNWIEMLESGKNLTEDQANTENALSQTSELLKKNVKKALDESKKLETAYRSLHVYFRNIGQDRVTNVHILNASAAELGDPDDEDLHDEISDRLSMGYDQISLWEHYSLLVIPEFLGNKKAVDRYAQLAHKNKVTLVTDYRDLGDFATVKKMFEKNTMTGPDEFLSNAIMACNYVIARAKNEEYGENEDIRIPPSTALAGRMYNLKMSQVAAGVKHGGLLEVEGVRFPMRKNELAQLENTGLVPVTHVKDANLNKIVPFSAKTLYNGDGPGMQTYSVVRVFDLISKVLQDFFNKVTWETATEDQIKQWQRKVVKYLDSIKGEQGLIKDYDIKDLKIDYDKPDKVNIDLFITPYFPARQFKINLGGRKGDTDDKLIWESKLD